MEENTTQPAEGEPDQRACVDVRSLQWTRTRGNTRQWSEVSACTWSPQGTHIVWTCGRGKVKAAPWNSDRGCLLSDDDTALDGTPLTQDRVIRTYDADSPVHCLAFGQRSSTGRQAGPCENTKGRYRFRVADDLILAAGQKGGRIVTWNMKSGRRFLVLMDHATDVTGVAFSPDGRLTLLSSSMDGTLKLWHLDDDGNMSHTFRTKVSSEKMLGCAWSPDSRLVCGVSDNRGVHLWNVDTKKHRKLKGHVNAVCSCKFSPDGALLVTASRDTSAIVWDAHTGQIMNKLRHVRPPPSELICGGYNIHYVRQLSMDRSGRYILTVCDDSKVRVWDVLNADVATEIAVTCKPLSCHFSPGGATLAVGTSSGLEIYKTPGYTMNLQGLCRTSIRRHLNSQTVNEVEQLYNYLPPALQAFLGYADLL